jgi:predicted secreted protein
MGDANRSYKVGLKTFTGTASVFFDETDTAQNAVDAGAEITLNIYPEGASSGDTYYTGSAIVTGRTINSSFDGMVEMEISFQGNGALTESTV